MDDLIEFLLARADDSGAPSMKRAIAVLYQRHKEHGEPMPWQTLRLLAHACRDYPAYRQAWAP